MNLFQKLLGLSGENQHQQRGQSMSLNQSEAPNQNQTLNPTTDQSETPSQRQAPENQPYSSAADNLFEGVSFDDLGFEGDGLGESAGASEIPAASYLLTKDQFAELLNGVHNMAGAITAIESVKVGADRVAAARVASDAIYDIALEVPALRFLIEPGNIWIQRAVAIGSFYVPMSLNIANELKMKRAAANEEAETDNQPDYEESEADNGGE